MPVSIGQPEENVKFLNGLIGWFNQSSVELIQEYRGLKERADQLTLQLEAKHRELNESLREREQARAYLLSVLESLNAGVLVLDPELRPKFANRKLTEMTGELNEECVFHLLGDNLVKNLQRGLKSVLPLECEKRVAGPDGATTPVHFILSPVVTGNEKHDYVLVFQDITLLKRLEAEAARTRRLASLGVMASELAHQIRNPLGGIELYASLLKESCSGDTRRLAGEILSAVQRLYTTLSHLLSFAAEPSISADVLPVDLLFEDVVQECGPFFNDPAWSLTVDIQKGVPPLWGDLGLLVQAMLNLIVNAKEAMPDGGQVAVTARLSPSSTLNGQIHRIVEIQVTDHGGGIAPENRERIFDPFFTTKRQGTGLGLAFTHKIVTAHRGSIEVASTPDRGSQFTLFLPAAEEL